MNLCRALHRAAAGLLAAAFVSLATPPRTSAATPASPTPPASPVRIASFRLTDQFGTEHAMEFPRAKPVLLLVGDRKGSEEVDVWIAPLKERWGTVADIAGIADVSAAPRFLRSRITEGIRRQRPRPLMLDFEGKVTDPLHCVAKTANLLVIDARGHVVTRVAGVPDPTRLAQIKAALDPLLESARSAAGTAGTSR